ncbi:MAG: virulence RhuM family protein [Fibrobacter sp.]|uniref:RhuM family protein n=1 Tax=Fibrobacter sp. TaxID=35828 RepID=UPI0025B8DB17|nr:RhuM family protein [Fibrobacter sp.]MBS7272995.1 virulence RhuM family protein [Fibrobacter sp.]
MKNVGLLPSGEVDGEKNEIIVYQPEGGEFHIEVRVDQDTVWLTQAQMAELFNSTRNNVTLHIKNIFQERELDANSVCKESLLTANDGKKYKTKIYNLDVIISVGYRVKSIQGTRFRQWALRVLKEHMLKGFSVNQRLVSHENKLENHDSRIIYLEKQVDFFVKANLPPKEGVLQAKAFWNGYEFAVQLVRSAKQEIVIIDPFADDTALSLMPKRNPGVNAIIYSARINQTMKVECERLNRQCPPVELQTMREVHDRFIVVDEAVYHIGASIKDLGSKLTAFSVLNFVSKQQLLEMIK